jgi:hypothetical protein
MHFTQDPVNQINFKIYELRSKQKLARVDGVRSFGGEKSEKLERDTKKRRKFHSSEFRCCLGQTFWFE